MDNFEETLMLNHMETPEFLTSSLDTLHTYAKGVTSSIMLTKAEKGVLCNKIWGVLTNTTASTKDHNMVFDTAMIIHPYTTMQHG